MSVNRNKSKPQPLSILARAAWVFTQIHVVL